ncbi:MAG: serine--tRNA ligase [Candidatus Makaraimicrobium thalassicum]|nr:MAG: serine--tRNA ligase [Candidatus Omnitrophota bacterium]
MLDPKFIRENADAVRKALKARRDDTRLVEEFLELDRSRKKMIQDVEDLKRQKNESSKKIGELIKKKADVSGAKAEVNALSEQISRLDNDLKEVAGRYRRLLDTIPNVLHESVPVGAAEEDNRLVREAGEIPGFSFTPRDHLELGQIHGLFDFERGAKITGSAFPLYIGAGARLERALFNFMLDVHVKEHGYREVFPPFLVNSASMRGTGQLPKLEEDMYKLQDEDFFLIPTAEVPVTNMHADEVLSEEELPVCYTAYTPCFRREAGSYGKDTKGLIRVHQFDKVELVKFTRPEDSMEELEKLLADAEDILKRLELPYRVLALCSADVSFAAHKCYDIELWAPGTGRWLEVSSCSVFTDFQARRANIKYQPVDRTQKPRYVHTLNGSGVALARLVIALLEIHQNENGSVTVPEALRPYFGSDSISAGMS